MRRSMLPAAAVALAGLTFVAGCGINDELESAGQQFDTGLGSEAECRAAVVRILGSNEARLSAGASAAQVREAIGVEPFDCFRYEGSAVDPILVAAAAEYASQGGAATGSVSASGSSPGTSGGSGQAGAAPASGGSEIDCRYAQLEHAVAVERGEARLYPKGGVRGCEGVDLSTVRRLSIDAADLFDSCKVQIYNVAEKSAKRIERTGSTGSVDVPFLCEEFDRRATERIYQAEVERLVPGFRFR